MEDEPNKEHPEDIESILSDLDAILTDMGGVAPALPETAPPPKPFAQPKPMAPLEEPKASPSIELAPRAGMIKPPEKKPEPPKPAPKLPDQTPIELSSGPKIPAPAPQPVPQPAPPPKVTVEAPAVPPRPTAVPSPGPVVASTKIEDLPADAPREQIRRVAYIYTFSCSGVKTAFALFLSQAARTISKKPIFLREVLSHEVGPASDPNAIVQKSLQVKASAVLAVVEDWPSAKVDELSEACLRANLLFRAVAPADAQKKSTAVDVIVDMMLLPGEG
ncbi:MAG: hypothetical protein AAB268_02340 [Elusimicrobiota bacterium]